MKFYHSRIFLITVLLQIVGPFIFSFGDWANIIQYLSAFGMAYALWDYTRHHKKEIRELRKQVYHLQQTHDLLHKLLERNIRD